jgi:hypothetical protein
MMPESENASSGMWGERDVKEEEQGRSRKFPSRVLRADLRSANLRAQQTSDAGQSQMWMVTRFTASVFCVAPTAQSTRF